MSRRGWGVLGHPLQPSCQEKQGSGPVVPASMTLGGQARTGVLPQEPGVEGISLTAQAPGAWLLSSLCTSPLPSPARQHCGFCQHARKLPVIYHTISDFVGFFFFILDIEAHYTALPH